MKTNIDRREFLKKTGLTFSTLNLFREPIEDIKSESDSIKEDQNNRLYTLKQSAENGLIIPYSGSCYTDYNLSFQFDTFFLI